MCDNKTTNPLEKLYNPCGVEDLPVTIPGEPWEYKPCQKKYALKAEDEISVDSIVSYLMQKVHPSLPEMRACDWDMDAKDMLNDKQNMLFAEQLYTSHLKETNCLLTEENKIFLEKYCEPVGTYCLSIEESYDGYVVFSHSKMSKGKKNTKCGHSVRGKYDDKFRLICEKRVEYDYIDSAKLEKSLETRIKNEILTAWKETKLNDESHKFRTLVNLKGRHEVLIMDGGVQILMRHLIINNFIGEFEYYTMNLFGKIMLCKLIVCSERKDVRIFHRTIKNTIRIRNTQYFDNFPHEESETFFTRNGHIVLHYWFGYNYIIHSIPYPVKPPEHIIPKLELMWKSDHILAKYYEEQKKLTYSNTIDYFSRHTEAVDYLYDFILSLLKFKPQNVLEFAIKFFHNMRNTTTE